MDNLDSVSDCTSRQALNSQSCCQTLGNESYCDSNGNAQTQLASGFQDVNNLDSVSDCDSNEELVNDCCVVSCTPPAKPTCSAGTRYSWDAANCEWDDRNVAKPCVTGTVHSWNCSSEQWDVSDAGPTSKLCQAGQDWGWDCPERN